MNKPFIDQNFLLQTKTAQTLYHNYAAKLPIIDYHCHLSPRQIAENTIFPTITNIWLDGDHYKWRAMRTCGVDEKYITGSAPDKEKFLAWAKTVPKTLKNPLYHWTHMELKNPFGITDRLLNSDTAEGIWEECNALLATPEFSSLGLLKRNKVEVVATTDDPTDSLEYHKQLKKEGDLGFIMVPTFRIDRAIEIENGGEFRNWVAKLEKAANLTIAGYNDFLEAFGKRHSAFHDLGCRASDLGLEEPYAADFNEKNLAVIFDKVMKGGEPTPEEVLEFKSAMIHHLGVLNSEKGWVMQLHIGAIRNNNTRMMGVLGRDTGFDSIGDFTIAKPLAKLLNRLDTQDQLPKTVLFNLNPRDNELFATMIGNFQDGSVPGKLQHGPPWWFLDQKHGIEQQIESLSNMGILSEFIGMTTDSRSFLSYPRHEYFRRILCNILGNDIENGIIPDDIELAGELVRRICYENPKNYFDFEI